MNVAIYGAGQFGNYVRKLLDSSDDINFKMFIDNQIFMCNRMVIVDEKTFLEGGYAKQVDCVWVAMVDKAAVENVVGSLLYNGYREIYIIDRNVFFSKIGLAGKIYSINNIRPEIGVVQFPVTEWCNLKCKSCAFCSNLISEKESLKLEDMEKDLNTLRQKFSNITFIDLIGGEPFSISNLDEYMYMAKLYFPNSRIQISTNGLYIPTLAPKVVQAIKATGARLRISTYKPTLKIIDTILSFGVQHGIEIIMTSPIEEFGVFLTKENKDYVTAWKNCSSHQYCHHLYNHRLYLCPILPYRIKHKDFFELEITEEEIEKNSVDILGNENGWEILAKIKHPVELCKYCSVYYQYIKWEICNEKPNKEDWYIKSQ